MDLPAQVLVVEDDTLIAAALEDILSDAGFRVLTCSSGEEAIAELNRDVTRFQVILTCSDAWPFGVGRRASST